MSAIASMGVLWFLTGALSQEPGAPSQMSDRIISQVQSVTVDQSTKHGYVNTLTDLRSVLTPYTLQELKAMIGDRRIEKWEEMQKSALGEAILVKLQPAGISAKKDLVFVLSQLAITAGVNHVPLDRWLITQHGLSGVDILFEARKAAQNTEVQNFLDTELDVIFAFVNPHLVDQRPPYTEFQQWFNNNRTRLEPVPVKERIIIDLAGPGDNSTPLRFKKGKGP
jgi:hypothetical protein